MAQTTDPTVFDYATEKARWAASRKETEDLIASGNRAVQARLASVQADKDFIEQLCRGDSPGDKEDVYSKFEIWEREAKAIAFAAAIEKSDQQGRERLSSIAKMGKLAVVVHAILKSLDEDS